MDAELCSFLTSKLGADQCLPSCTGSFVSGNNHPCTEWTIRDSNDDRHEIFLRSKRRAVGNEPDRHRECRSKRHAVCNTVLRQREVLGSDLGHDIGFPHSLRSVDQATNSSFDILPNSSPTTISTVRRSESQSQIQLPLSCPTPQKEQAVQSTNDPVPRVTPSLYGVPLGTPC